MGSESAEPIGSRSEMSPQADLTPTAIVREAVRICPAAAAGGFVAALASDAVGAGRRGLDYLNIASRGKSVVLRGEDHRRRSVVRATRTRCTHHRPAGARIVTT